MIWKLSPTLESLAVGRTIVNSNRKKKKKKNNQQGLLYVNNIINKNKNVKTNNISKLEESIFELRSRLPQEVLNYSSPFNEILEGQHKEEIKHAFYEKPRKRNETDLRYITLWLLNTDMTKDLPLLVRMKLARIVQMSKYFPANMLLATEVNRQRIIESGELPSPPTMVSVVFDGQIKQKSKATLDERVLDVHSSFGELQALGNDYSEDTVGIFAGARGVDLVQIPLKDYKLLIAPYRLRILNSKVEALQRSPLFKHLSKGQLGRMALGAKTMLFKHRQVAIRQNEEINCMYIVSKGSFVSGRTVSMKQKNIWPEHSNKKGERNNINNTSRQIVKHIRVAKSAPCVTVNRHGLGSFFGEEGNTSLFDKKLLVTLLLLNQQNNSKEDGANNGDNADNTKSKPSFLKSPEQIKLEKWVDTYNKRKQKNKAWASVVSEGASEVVCLNAADFKLLLPKDRFEAFELIRKAISIRPNDASLRKKAQVRKLMQNVKHSILRRGE